MSACDVTDKTVSPKKRKARLCSACAAKLPPAKKPRDRMSIDHAVETVRGVLINRLDTLAAGWVDENRERYGLSVSAWLDVFQSLQLALFPEEFSDAPAGRMDAPPPAGLVPRRPQVAIYAKHLEKGKASPVSALTTTEKDKQGNSVTVPLFTDAELARLGERQERRQSAAVACGI